MASLGGCVYKHKTYLAVKLCLCRASTLFFTLHFSGYGLVKRVLKRRYLQMIDAGRRPIALFGFYFINELVLNDFER